MHGLFFGSGAVALVYEVLWMRRLTLLLGATAPATATTLAAFFLGLGLGSVVLGTRSARWRRPLLAFGLIEAGIGGAALLVEPLLSLLEGATPRITAALAEQPAASLAAKMLLASIAILPPALLMGGSLPVLAQAAAPRSHQLGVNAGGLYAINTLGAALGCLAVPTVLLPALGASGTQLAAVACSFAIGAVALGVDFTGRKSRISESLRTYRVEHSPKVFSAPFRAPVLLAGAFLSGAVALGLEVLWTRMLALVHENSVQSFATVIAVYLLGIGLGAALARSLLNRGWLPLRLLGVSWIGAGLWTVMNPKLFWLASSGLAYVRASGGLFEHELKIAGLALLTLFPATMLSGVALPVLMQLSGGGRTDAGPVIGRLFGVNTLGAIVGPLAAVFLVGPALGLWWGLTACGLILILAGELALRGVKQYSLLAKRLPFYALVASLIVVLDPGSLPRARIQPGERLIDLREGAFGTVAVVEHEGDRRLVLNNHYLIGGTASTGEERLQAHIPLLLHPEPGAVAFLGLGTGITASAVLFHPVRDVVVLELVPEILDAARRDFHEANLGLLEDSRVRAVAADARAYLLGSVQKFDVIVGDLVVPWRRGESSLYTMESFEAAHRALARRGIYCQWLPLFQLSKTQFESIAATFVDVFPQTLLWRGDFRAGEPAVALIGLAGDEPLDPAIIESRSRAYAQAPDLSNPYLADPGGLWAFLVGPVSPENPTWRNARRSRDARPLIELESAAAHMSGSGTAFSHERLKPFLDALLAAPLGGTPLEKLDERHLRWRQAGDDIWEASLLSLQGRNSEADTRGLDALSRLPVAVQQAVLGRSPASQRP